MDGPRFARNLDSVYRDVWRHFCAETASQRFASASQNCLFVCHHARE
jgi:hypothetical protein